jgi:hypothetical protein
MAIKLFTVMRQDREEASLEEVEKLERDLAEARALDSEPNSEDSIVVTNLKINRSPINLLNDPSPAYVEESSSEDEDYN